MLSEADRKKAAESLLQALRDKKPIVQLSKTYPEIAIEDAYAIQSLVNEAKVAAGAKVRGHKVGLTSKAMQQSSQIDEPDYGVLMADMFYDDGAILKHADFCVPRVEMELGFVLGKRLKGPGRRPARRADRDRMGRAVDRGHRRARAEPAQDLRHGGGQRCGGCGRDRRPAGAADRRRPALGRRPDVPQRRHRGERALRRACSVIPRSASRGSPTRSGGSAPRSSPATSRSPGRSSARSGRTRETRCARTSVRSARSACSLSDAPTRSAPAEDAGPTRRGPRRAPRALELGERPSTPGAARNPSRCLRAAARPSSTSSICAA